jgi:phosphoenolpyruvate---glycerone phosphotransferase subunit DhaL
MSDRADRNVLEPADVREMLEAVCARLVESVDVLTAADQAIGDGDHGVAMRRGFAAALELLKADQSQGSEAMFKTVGSAVLSKAGGAAGAVFGTFFRSGAAALAGRQFGACAFALFLQRGLEGVERRGGAHPGQKTMLDALAPAAEAAAKAESEGLAAAIQSAAVAAAKGVENTKTIVATTGKAKTLGKRSLGHADPGAISVSLILEAMREYMSRP